MPYYADEHCKQCLKMGADTELGGRPLCYDCLEKEGGEVEECANCDILSQNVIGEDYCVPCLEIMKSY